MKTIKLIFLSFLSCSFFYHFAFASDLKVGVSIPPLAEIVEQLSNQTIQPIVLFGDSVNPHLYEPKPSQVKAFAKISAYFSLGLETEAQWLENLQHAQIIHLNQTLPLLEGHGHEEEEDDDHHDEAHEEEATEGNPHTWMSPTLMKIHVLKIYQVLAQLDPKNQETYFNNHQKLQQQIDALDLKIQQKLSVLQRPASFLTVHPSLGYFALTYNLQELAIEDEGKAPSLQHLVALQKQAKTLGIGVILSQPQIPLKEASSLADSLNLPIETFNPLAKNWQDQLLNVADLIVRYQAK